MIPRTIIHVQFIVYKKYKKHLGLIGIKKKTKQKEFMIKKKLMRQLLANFFLFMPFLYIKTHMLKYINYTYVYSIVFYWLMAQLRYHL